MEKPRCCDLNSFGKDAGLLAGFLKAAAEENRLKILCLLKQGERCVCDIWQNLDIPQNLASHHLRVLSNSGLIDSRRDGLKMIYSLNKDKIAQFNTLLSNFLVK